MKDGDEEIFKNYDQPAAAEIISLICTTFSKKGRSLTLKSPKIEKKTIGVLYRSKIAFFFLIC